MMTAANYEIAESLRSLSIEFNEFLATK